MSKCSNTLELSCQHICQGTADRLCLWSNKPLNCLPEIFCPKEPTRTRAQCTCSWWYSLCSVRCKSHHREALYHSVEFRLRPWLHLTLSLSLKQSEISLAGILFLPNAGLQRPGNNLEVVTILESFQKLMLINSIFNY